MQPEAQAIQEQLRAFGLPSEVREFSSSTRSADAAAAALDVDVDQIVKCLVFVVASTPVLALVAGSNRLDPGKLERFVSERPRQATPDEVFAATGFAVGGVAPIGHKKPLSTFMDEELLEHDYVYAAAGTPNAVFGLPPLELARITSAEVVDLRACSEDG